ncbi:uncharacterized protein LOC127795375 [Diospyros lotus]|uniref:uncharacterized protein LOC127795375 n=1 Tax=Diospyros lotus TaxID=55363 RepID=UPI002258D5C4|nr:uncharacterized protein LOC127795375 [Diospyros lotus]
MAFHNLFGFVGILTESIKLAAQTGRAMAAIAAVSALLNSLFLFISLRSSKSILRDLRAKEFLLLFSGPRDPDFANLLHEIKEDALIILAVEFAVFLASFLVTVFSSAATILISAAAFSGQSSPFKDLASRLGNSSVRLIVTSFYLSLFLIGYVFSVMVFLIPYGLLIADFPLAAKAIAVVVGIIAAIFWIYTAVVLHMAVVVSVIEERCYGLEAVGKAAGLVKGKNMKLHGFVLNSIFMLALNAVIYISRTVIGQKSESIQMIVWSLAMILVCGLAVFENMNYTVMYSLCKKTKEEEIELHGSVEYSKLPSMAALADDPPSV